MPIFISAKNCRESQEIISVSKCLAISMASLVLPIPVVPMMEMSFFTVQISSFFLICEEMNVQNLIFDNDGY